MRGRGPSASSKPTWPPPPETLHRHLGRTSTPLHARRPIACPGAIGGRGIYGSCRRVCALWLCAARRRPRLNATTRCRWAETAECDGTLESMSRNGCPACSMRTCANCLILSCVLIDQMSPFDRDALDATAGLGEAAMRVLWGVIAQSLNVSPARAGFSGSQEGTIAPLRSVDGKIGTAPGRRRRPNLS
jgi:hypothetical protein